MKNCPNCQSDQFKKATLINAEGQSVTAGLGVGVSAGGIGAGFGGGVTSTALAAKCAPPKLDKDAFAKQSGNWMLLIFFVPLIIAYLSTQSFSEVGFFWKVWAGLGFAYMAWMNHKFDKAYKDAFANSLADYEKTYMCLRCGTMFKPFE